MPPQTAWHTHRWREKRKKREARQERRWNDHSLVDQPAIYISISTHSVFSVRLSSWLFFNNFSSFLISSVLYSTLWWVISWMALSFYSPNSHFYKNTTFTHIYLYYHLYHLLINIRENTYVYWSGLDLPKKLNKDRVSRRTLRCPKNKNAIWCNCRRGAKPCFSRTIHTEVIEVDNESSYFHWGKFHTFRTNLLFSISDLSWLADELISVTLLIWKRIQEPS